MFKISLVFFVIISAFGPLVARSEEVFRIEIGNREGKASTEELRRRVWMLERAVAQMQTRIYQLESDGSKSKAWTCQIQSFGKTHMATEPTKGAALAIVLKKCSDATNAIHCKESDVSCND